MIQSTVRKTIYARIGGSLLLLLSMGWGFAILLWPYGGQGRIAENQPVSGFVFPSETDYLLLVFGFPGCGDSCPITLASLSHTLQTYERHSESTASQLKVGFVNLLPDLAPKLTTEYVKNFHPAFEHYPLTDHERSALLQEFGVYATPSIQNEQQLYHSSFVYLLQRREAQWFRVQTFLEPAPPTDKILEVIRQFSIHDSFPKAQY